MTAADRHEFFLGVEPEFFMSLQVSCPYDAADETRPCWPHYDTGPNGEWLPMDAPQTDCTYEDWVSNTDLDEILYGGRVVPLGPVVVEWDAGAMKVHL